MAEVSLHGEQLTKLPFEVVDGEASAGIGRLLVLPGNRRPPAHSPWSWVNERGQGQLVGIGAQVIACRLLAKLPGDPSAAEGSVRKSERHPQAGYWLALAAGLHARCTLRILQALTGYSYPAVYEWARRESAAGRLRIERDGKVQMLSPEAGALPVWWELINRWWPALRGNWPKRHGPVAVHWARSADRLPVRLVGESIPGGQPADVDALWATGADHLAALGELIQPFDSDVWLTASTWQRLQRDVRILEAPGSGDRWSGTRFTVFADDHPLIRLLWYAGGTPHPACSAVAPDWADGHRRGDLLTALPLLDAQQSPDARVREVGLAAMSTMDGILA